MAAKKTQSKSTKKISVPPVKGLRHFVFHSCTVEQAGKALTVTVPKEGLTWRGAKVDKQGHTLWSQPAGLAASAVAVTCGAGKAQARMDGSEYPTAAKIADGATFTFSGALSFGRVLHGEASKLVVQAKVAGVKGLPKGTSWSGFESIEIDGSAVTPVKGAKVELADGGDGSGPHQPYP